MGYLAMLTDRELGPAIQVYMWANTVWAGLDRIAVSEKEAPILSANIKRVTGGAKRQGDRTLGLGHLHGAAAALRQGHAGAGRPAARRAAQG
jgi:hypothetical protein